MNKESIEIQPLKIRNKGDCQQHKREKVKYKKHRQPHYHKQFFIHIADSGQSELKRELNHIFTYYNA